jgi:hypothetical protein
MQGGEGREGGREGGKEGVVLTFGTITTLG